jgi:hypothetical protein
MVELYGIARAKIMRDQISKNFISRIRLIAQRAEEFLYLYQLQRQALRTAVARRVRKNVEQFAGELPLIDHKTIVLIR